MEREMTLRSSNWDSTLCMEGQLLYSSWERGGNSGSTPSNSCSSVAMILVNSVKRLVSSLQFSCNIKMDRKTQKKKLPPDFN